MSDPDHSETLDADPTVASMSDGGQAAGAGREDPVERTPGEPGDGPEPSVLGGRYLLEERIASGGMASVWRAHDELLARTVAVKILHAHLAADQAFRERFRREAVSAAKLSHPNVVSLYDTGKDGDRVYLVMEYVDGTTLKDVIADLGMLEPDQVAAIGEKVARALGYAHQRGLVHRDVKPANILIGTDGTVKVADFGIAKAEEADDGLTRTGMVLGTAAYVAPEQILSQPVDGRTDQYALGIVLYEALTGRQPFKADSPVATAALRLEKSPLPVRSLRADAPRGFDALVMRTLARDPRDRFRSAEELADALAPWAGMADDTRTAALALPATGASPLRGGRGRAATPTSRPPNAPSNAPRNGHGRGSGTGRRDAWPGGPAGLRGDVATTGPAVGTAPRRSESFLRTEGRWLAPVLGLLLLAGVLVAVGLATGVIESADGFPIRIAQDRDGDGAPDDPVPPDDVGPVTPTGIEVFDPQGSGGERDGDLPNLLDGNPETTWRTQRYNSAPFGGLKEGVGFILDLGDPHVVDEVRLVTTTPGVGVQLRAADEPASTADGWTVVATSVEEGDVVTLRPAEPVTARFLLVWLTGPLAPGGGGFIAQYRSVEVQGRPA
jgi:eukaryotic-like serine/threonine-protein kinase